MTPSHFQKSKPSLTTLPQEILLQIAKQVCILDIFILRRVCRSLYSRLSGADNQPLYFYFLNKPKKKRRLPYFNKSIDYFGIIKSILSGKAEGCGICLRDVKDGGFVAHKGRVFFKRVCGGCARSHFTELYRLESTHPTLNIHPNQRITWSSSNGDHPFDTPSSANTRWITFPRECILNTDLKSIIPSSPSSRNSVGKEAYHARYNKQIHFALQKKEAADIVVSILTEEYERNYGRLHWLKPPHDFEEYIYNSLLWNLRPWLSPHHTSEGKGLPKLKFADRVEELQELYTESEALLDELRIKGLRNACKAVLKQELKIPRKGKDVRKPGRVAPLIRYWISEWLGKRGWKGVPGDGKDLRNCPRGCPFCEDVKVGCTMALTVHVWWRHGGKLDEEWRWIPVEPSV
ncbi:uncharacterized protein DFL_003080 [Arthrobotrys flagrans]|uniref:F-box domain-containing protein n=1 Tax=Arthrobotrys flagrans TaxID=97331 RepID=A0A437ADN7_ARTFL|nr:hypothetical protein DFL_003080 [Arthrobotrys flagrans]